MKKIIKPILLLSSICCLVGCGKDSLPLVGANYTTAQAKAFRMCYKINNFTFEELSHKQIKSDIHSNVKGRVVKNNIYLNNHTVCQFDFEKRICSSLLEYETDYGVSEKGINATTTFYDSEVGIISTKSIPTGDFYTILMSNEDIELEVTASDEYENKEDYLNNFFFNEFMNSAYDNFFLMSFLSEITSASESDFISDAEKYKLSFRLNNDAFELDAYAERVRNEYTPFGYGKVTTTKSANFHYDDIFCTKFEQHESRLVVNTADEEVLYDIKSNNVGSVEFKTDLKKPSLDKYFKVTVSEFVSIN